MHARRSLCALALLLLTALPACRSENPPPPAASTTPPPGDGEILDAHVHLTDMEAVPALLGLLDQKGVKRAVVLATPDATAGRGGKGLAGYQRGNEVVLAAAAAHPTRLIPFVTLDLAHDRPETLDALLARGACGVKLYDGHHAFHERPLDDPSHRPLFARMEERGVPVLMHVNTVRFRAELEGVLGAFPKLRAICPHLCGSRTDLDRFESIRDAFPSLLFDTSHGSSDAAAQGFTYLEKEHDRLRAILEKTPERFLFGSDLVTVRAGPTWREEWDMQVSANLGLLRDETFTFWRQNPQGGLSPAPYRGQALPAPLLQKILGENARRWLDHCVR
ncbi:amidohydrolase family protein [Polyangium sp. 6x1]|uniref:amidohydrolase family protein n=1 Tax=Polyangium sp. 6x1 TaxID=3042689 RepID=UPI0024832793|nr:amidohydrolase family protein [Polyangium sp. 6x1]MDI1442684.1 amidohydrolase family protein [Polyangium sp. 6x1]